MIHYVGECSASGAIFNEQLVLWKIHALLLQQHKKNHTMQMKAQLKYWPVCNIWHISAYNCKGTLRRGYWYSHTIVLLGSLPKIMRGVCSIFHIINNFQSNISWLLFSVNTRFLSLVIISVRHYPDGGNYFKHLSKNCSFTCFTYSIHNQWFTSDKSSRKKKCTFLLFFNVLCKNSELHKH